MGRVGGAWSGEGCAGLVRGERGGAGSRVGGRGLSGVARAGSGQAWRCDPR